MSNVPFWSIADLTEVFLTDIKDARTWVKDEDWMVPVKRIPGGSWVLDMSREACRFVYDNEDVEVIYTGAHIHASYDDYVWQLELQKHERENREVKK